MTLDLVSDATETGTKNLFTHIFEEQNLSFISTMHVIMTKHCLSYLKEICFCKTIEFQC